MSVQNPYPSLVIKLFNDQHEPVGNAEFFLKKALNNKGRLLKPVFDPGLGVYTFTESLNGEYILTVVHKHYLPEEQPVVLAPGKKQELIITLSERERPYFILGSRRIFYTPPATSALTAAGRNIRSVPENERDILQGGNILEAGNDGMILLTSEITVKFKDSASDKQIKDFLAGFQLAVSREPKVVNLYQLHSASGTDHELLELCKEIRFHPIVESVDSNVASTRKLLALHPSDYLYIEQWDHKLINVADAWEKLQQDPQAAAKGNTAFGNPQLIIGVIDAGIDLSHPDLNVTLSNGAPKISQVFDFQNMVANMDNPASPHGTKCSSVATGFTNTGEGIAGIAGNSQLMAIIFNDSSVKDADMFEWVAGIDPDRPAFPPVPKGAAVISNSWNPSFPILTMPDAAALDRITTYGRQGRGTLVFVAAANDSRFYESRSPHATHPKVFAISASTLDDTGQHEIFTPYSNFGAGIQFCAPSASTGEGVHNPPLTRNTFTATHRPGAPHPVVRNVIHANPIPATAPPNSLRVVAHVRALIGDEVLIGDPANPGSERFEIIDVDRVEDIITLDRPWVRVPVKDDPVLKIDGNCPGSGSTHTTLAADAVPGRTIVVNNIGLFTAGKAVMINPNTVVAEAHAIQRVDLATNTVHLMSNIRRPGSCTTGTRVDVGPADYTNNFGGTSHSAPVCAGIAMLCLAANKNLSWVEVRDLMRHTARKINIGETGKFTGAGGGNLVGKWRDIDGKDIVSIAGNLISLNPIVLTKLVSTDANGTVLTLQSAAGFEKGQAVNIRRGIESEFRVVAGVSGNTITLDGPLVHAFPAGSDVEAGFKPHYSALYGFGRVDAGKAVQAALDAEKNYRQLVIRNNLTDTGVIASADIQSPDIWVTNHPLEGNFTFRQQTSTAGLNDFSFSPDFTGHQNTVFQIKINDTNPTADTFEWKLNEEAQGTLPITDAPQLLADGFSIRFGARTGHRVGDNWTVHIDRTEPVMDYTSDAPHENPLTASDRFIHARIKNRVTGALAAQYTNLDCWVRFYIALSSGKTANAIAQGAGFDSNFYFSDTGKNNDWESARKISTLTTGEPGIYFAGEVAIPEGAIPPDNSNTDKGSYIVSIPWKKEAIPPAALEHSVYLMTHIAPFHGPLNGTGAHNNSCLSYREIAFAQFFLQDDVGNALPKQLETDAFGSLITQPFNIVIQADAGNLLTEKLQLEIVRINDNGTEEKAVFHHDGTAWVFAPALPAWPGLLANAPLIFGTADPATGSRKQIFFTGEFHVAKEHQRIIIRPQILSRHSTAIIAAHEHTIDILQQGEMPNGIDPDTLVMPPPPRSHAFADMANLSQGIDQCFGPVSGQEAESFRVTSLFTASVDTNAYAITDGLLFFQPGADPKTVNLVLKPFKQPVIGFTPVKYFVYRGLRKTDFLDPANETKVLPEHVSNSAFIKRQRAIFTAQNKPGADFLSKALGYDPAHQAADSILDSYFFNGTPGIQLPFVTRGTQLGRFLHSNNAFGLDILLEEGSFTTALVYVRKKAHVVSVNGMGTGTDAARLLKKLRQEEILNFLDPAAFYGLHAAQKGIVETKNAAGDTLQHKGMEIYTPVINPFFTRNKIYLDIRNENGNSYNFYGNYKGPAGDPDLNKNIRLGTTKTQLVPQIYQTHGWPVIIQDRPAQNTTTDTSQLFCAFRFDDNKKPMLFVETGTISNRSLPTPSPQFVDAFELGDFVENATWTLGIGFDIPLTGPPGAKLAIAPIIKLFYSRSRIDTTWPDTVLKTESPTDNMFGPLNLDPLWNADSQIKWIAAQDKKFVDLGSHGYMAERGVALDGVRVVNAGTGRVVFFGVASDYFANAGFQNIKGITGGVSTRGTFFEAANFFQDLKLLFDQLIIGGSKITTLQLTPGNSGQALSPNAMLLLCISRQEQEALKTIPGFHPSYARYARLEFIQETRDDKNKLFSKYQLKVQGLDGNGRYKLAAPVNTIFVYTVDRFLYFSDAYSKDEPIPTTYNRTAEENIGALVNPVTKQTWEDFFIKKDTRGPLQDAEKSAGQLVQAFIDAVNAVPNDADAKESLEAHINNFPAGLLNRMLALAADDDNKNADDRILYWSRIRMKVALQSHAWLLQSFQNRNELLELFERISRGYDEIDFSPAGLGIKKVLITGFDPYFLHPAMGSAHNVLNSNPSGAAALALNNEFIDHIAEGTQVAYVQSVVFPARYADFDKNGGEGIVESFFNRFLDPTDADYMPVDLIIVMDKYQPGSCMFGRFAARKRGIRKDNNFQHSADIPMIISGHEFLESTLPVRSSLTGLKYKHFYNQAYEYRIKANKAIKKFRDEKRTGAENIPDNPLGNDPANLLPVNQPSTAITATRGAFDPYFGNEIFYRLCALREKKNKAAKTGLLMLPRLQGTDAEAATNKKIKKDFDGALTKEVIDELKDMISTMASFGIEGA